MRKSTKIAVVLAAAALLVAGFAFTTLAKGWVKEAEGLYYYEDEYGMKVYNEWKKDTDPNTGAVSFYYLGDDGYMVTDTLVTDSNGAHWCGPDGARVSNQWIKVPASEEDQHDLEVEYRWYRFNKNGIALTGKQTIEDKLYFFDGDGKMLYGYVVYANDAVQSWTTKVSDSYVAANENVDTYYCGTNEEGWALKGDWRKESVDDSGDSWEGSKSFWAFYQTSGKRATSALSNGALWKGQRYYFTEEGKMVTGWGEATYSVKRDDKEVVATKSTYYGGADDGKKVKKAWVYAVPKDKADQDNKDEKKRWFYFDNSGMAIAEENGCVLKINGKYYAFAPAEYDNYASKMLAGLVEVHFGSKENLGDAKWAKAAKIWVSETEQKAASKVTLAQWIGNGIYDNFYYFSGDEANDGSLKKSTSFEQEFMDDTYTLYVDKEGKLSNGYVGKKYYINGYLMKADTDARYQIKTVAYWNEDRVVDGKKKAGYSWKHVVLSAAGAETTKGYVADADGTYYAVKDGIAYVAESSLVAPAQAASAVYNGKDTVTAEGYIYDVVTYPRMSVDGKVDVKTIKLENKRAK